MEYHLKNPHWQRGDLNLRHRYQSTALLSSRPSAFPKKGSIKSRDKQLLSLPFVHVFPYFITDANFYDINIKLL